MTNEEIQQLLSQHDVKDPYLICALFSTILGRFIYYKIDDGQILSLTSAMLNILHNALESESVMASYEDFLDTTKGLDKL